MTQIDEVIGRESVVWSFGPDMRPLVEVEPGAVVRFETNDCFTGQIRSEADLVTGIDMGRINSATGPVAVRGAEPGDSLVAEILEVNPIEWGVATLIPGFGQLIERVKSPVTRIFKVSGGMIEMNDRVRFPARPMVGVVGVATGGEEMSNGLAGEHGGNLDNHLHGPGARLYLPVRQPAACSRSATCTPRWATAKSASPAWRSRAMWWCASAWPRVGRGAGRSRSCPAPG